MYFTYLYLLNQEECNIKLFKKIAAIAVATVMMFSMVGCGAQKAGISQKDDIMNILEDTATIMGGEFTHDKKLDDVAQALIVEADKAYKEGKTVQELLTNDEVAKAAGIDTAKEGYMMSVTKNYTFKSDVMNQQKNTMLATRLIEGTSENLQVGKPAAINKGKAITGIAIGKIGGQEYIVLIAAAPAQAK